MFHVQATKKEGLLPISLTISNYDKDTFHIKRMREHSSSCLTVLLSCLVGCFLLFFLRRKCLAFAVYDYFSEKEICKF